MKERLKYYLILGLLKPVALLPLPVLYGISDFIYVIIKYVVRYRHRVITGNLRRSFPEKDEREILRIEDRYYRHMADLIVESVKLLHISDKTLRKHVETRHGEVIERLAADGKPVVLFLGHYGNWEWAQEVTRHYRKPAYTCELYRRVRDKATDDLMKTLRGRFDTHLIEQNKAVRTLLSMSMKGQQYLVGFIADQRPYNMGVPRHWTTFLNQDTAYVTGGEEIGNHVGAHFAFLWIEKPRRGHYVMTFKDMRVPDGDSGPFPYTREYLRMMEANIRQAPQYWLWSHNRWKYGHKGEKIH